MSLPTTATPHLDSIGNCLLISLNRHMANNADVKTAISELAFEIDLARRIDSGAVPAQAMRPAA